MNSAPGVARRLRYALRLSRRTERLLLLNVSGAIVGILGGIGAIVFRMMISFNRWLFFEFLLPKLPLHWAGLNWGVMLMPALGGLIIGPVILRLAPETKGHGVPEVMEAVALKGGRIRRRVAFLKILVSSITIGSGGSAGREGPIAQIGASLGSLIGEHINLDSRDRRLLVVCGLSSGIAGTFNAPLGGMLFGLEVLYRGIEPLNAVPVALASVMGAAVVTAYYGPKPSFIAPPTLTFSNPVELVFYLLLGLIFGVISVVWVKTFYAVESLFERLKIYDGYKQAIGGLATGIIGMFLIPYGVMGVGYEGINMVLAGKLGLTLLLVLGIAKMVATSFTIGSGNSGGVFAPSLYMGAMFGGALGLLFDMIFPNVITEPFTYSLAGMAALFAGAAQAPLSMIIMIPEMSNDYSLLPPIMASSVTSFAIAHLLLRGSSIYTLKLERRGVRIRISRQLV